MKVVISAGGRFHAHHLAHQLMARKSLHKFFTFDYKTSDREKVPQKFVHIASTCKFLNDWFVTLQANRFISSARFNVFKDNLFDTYVSKQLLSLAPFDIFVGWAHYAHQSLTQARIAGAKIIIESGSCHIKTQQKLLQKEYDKWGVPFHPIEERTIEKMCAEYEHADYIMTLSSYARKSFVEQGITSSKILMVPCGVDIDFFMAPSVKKIAPKFRVIFVGLVSLRKGIPYLLQAWRRLKIPRRDSELLIVGAHQKDFTIAATHVPLSENVKFIGSVDRTTLRTLYHQSSLFVLPSIEDGFGMVIGEAMASGLPVLCSTQSAGPELIINGKHGFTIQPHDIQDIAEKIQWCYDHRTEATEMGLRGQDHIHMFSWDNYGEKVFETYRKILGTS